MEEETSEGQSDETSPLVNNRHANNRQYTIAILFIVLTALFSSVTFFTVQVNLVLYCTYVMGLTPGKAVMVNSLFTGTAYFLPIFGGLFADVSMGRFTTIICGLSIEMLGSIFLFISPYAKIEFAWRLSSFIVGLVLLALGHAFMKPNILPFAVQQTDLKSDETVRSIVHSYYFGRNIGAIIGFCVASYVEEQISFEYGFIFSLVSSFLSIVCFAAGKKWYEGTDSIEGHNISRYVGSYFQSLKCCGKQLIRMRSTANIFPLRDQQMEQHEGRYIFWQEGKLLLVVSSTMVFWTVWNQQGTTYYLEGQVMSQIGDGFPITFLAFFDIIVLLVGIPILEFSPIYRLSCSKKYMSAFVRIFYGMVFAIITVFAAGTVEYFRIEDIAKHGVIKNSLGMNASHTSIWIQSPVYLLTGLAELFTALAALEMIIVASPPYCRGLSVGLLDTSQGVGAFFNQFLVFIIQSGSNWYPHDINKGHLDNFLYLLCGIMGISTLLYIGIVYVTFFRRSEAEDKLNSYRFQTNFTDTIDYVEIT